MEAGKPGKGTLTMESKAVIIRVLQRFQANVPQELRAEVAVVTRLALTGHSGRFPEDIETEASDKYKEASCNNSTSHTSVTTQFGAARRGCLCCIFVFLLCGSLWLVRKGGYSRGSRESTSGRSRKRARLNCTASLLLA